MVPGAAAWENASRYDADATGRLRWLGGRWSLVTLENGSAVDAPVDTAPPADVTGAGEVEDTEELLVEEISIDGMCGVY